MYPHLASPGRIGGLTLPNRVAMTAASASLSQPDGTMTRANSIAINFFMFFPPKNLSYRGVLPR